MADEELKAFHKRVADRIVAAYPDRRERLNAGAKKTIEAFRLDIPDASDEVLIDVLTEVAFMMTQFSALTVDSLAAALENSFNNTSLAAATLIGVYDPEDDTAPTKTLEEVVEDQQAEAVQRAEDLNQNTGLYL